MMSIDCHYNIIYLIPQSQRSPGSTRKAEASSDLDRLRDIFFDITECKNDSQQRGWAVHDDQQAIMDLLEELLQILVSLAIAFLCIYTCTQVQGT